MRSDELSAPLMSTVDITDVCNLNCAYCYAHNDRVGFVPKDRIVQTILDLHDAGVWQIVIGGGEPFLHPDLLEILDVVLRRGVRLSLTSNGTVGSGEDIDRIASLQRRYEGRLSIQISLDGPSPEINDRMRGAGERLFRNIERMLEAGLEIGLGTVLHARNIAHLGKIIERYYPRIKRFHFLGLMPSHSVVRGPEGMYPTAGQFRTAALRVLQLRRRYPDIAISFPAAPQFLRGGPRPTMHCCGCTAAVTRMDINARGEALACHIADRSVMGNVWRQSVLDIWRSERARKYRNAERPLCGRDLFQPSNSGP